MKLMSSKEAAKYLGYADTTLRISRTTGRLSGIEAPKFIKIGTKTVRYKKEHLDEWVDSIGG